MLETIAAAAGFLWHLEFSKVLTLVVAAFAVYVAYRQYRLGRERFKLDLFEKRFAVFDATRRLLSVILRDANVSLDALFEFRAARAEASFLFDADITDYLDAIDKKALRLLTCRDEMRPLPVGEERSKAAQEIKDTLTWLNDQLPEVTRRFNRYLKFRTWT